MLNKSQKEQIIANLAKSISSSATTVVCNYKGMSVSDFSELRGKLRGQGAELVVAKKTLTKIAFERAGYELDVTELPGQTAVVFGGDEVFSAKTLYEFSKSVENLKILAGTLEEKVITQEEVLSLAKLPSKEELLAKLVGSLNAPLSGLVNVLSGNSRKLVYALNAIKEAKESDKA